MNNRRLQPKPIELRIPSRILRALSQLTAGGAELHTAAFQEHTGLLFDKASRYIDILVNDGSLERVRRATYRATERGQREIPNYARLAEQIERRARSLRSMM